MSIAEKLTTIADNTLKVYEAGKKQQESDFWDAYQNYGNRTHYTYAFAYRGWNDKTYKPKYPIAPTEAGSSIFWLAEITDTIVPIDLTQTTTANPQPFGYCSKLKRVPLVKVRSGMIYTNWFLNNFALEDITFEGVIDNDLDMKQCHALSMSSMRNIISCLSPDVTGKTLTLSKTAVDKAFPEGNYPGFDEIVSAFGKTNWTYSFV